MAVISSSLSVPGASYLASVSTYKQYPQDCLLNTVCILNHLFNVYTQSGSWTDRDDDTYWMLYIASQQMCDLLMYRWLFGDYYIAEFFQMKCI